MLRQPRRDRAAEARASRSTARTPSSQGPPASYTLSADGLTVRDNLTGLTWQRSPDTNGDGTLTRGDKLTWTQARALPGETQRRQVRRLQRLAPADDQGTVLALRLPRHRSQRPARHGHLAPDAVHRHAVLQVRLRRHERRRARHRLPVRFEHPVRRASRCAGVGQAVRRQLRRRPHQGLRPADARRRAEQDVLRAVRARQPGYGSNDFLDNGDGTITDRATGLMWSQGGQRHGHELAGRAGLGAGAERGELPRPQRLAPAQRQGTAEHRGLHARRRTRPVRPPSIRVFTCTRITNEAGKADFPCYWTGTTHAGFMGGAAAMYVAFGRAAGWMPSRPRRDGPRGGPGAGRPPGPAPRTSGGGYRFTDVHGGGRAAQRPQGGRPRNVPARPRPAGRCDPHLQLRPPCAR